MVAVAVVENADVMVVVAVVAVTVELTVSLVVML